ncbi:MAG: iron ABC transporter permease [Acidimicrobiales bacterium]|nr:iron ABC transporter permease [Acidimicrobiales bacterium]
MTATARSARTSRAGWSAAAIAAGLLALVPVLAVLGGVLQPNGEVWRQQWETRLPGQIVASLVLVAGVGTATIVIGVGLAWLVGAHDFPGRRLFSWALVLPLALPAYILGFVITSTLGVAGPVQTWWRDSVGRDAWFPEIRSMPMAIATFSLTLYPYVYLMARAALRDQAGDSFAVARSLGAGPAEAFRRVVLPMLRPAIAAGAAIVVMETLTDFATVQYFGVDTVTVGVFRIWRGTYDRDAAAEIASLVLAFAFFAIVAERVLRGRARFAEAGGMAAGFARPRLRGWRGAAASVTCATVVLVAFAAPILRLATWALAEQRSSRGTPLTDRYADFLSNSLVLTLTTVAICLVVAVLVVNAHRFVPTRAVSAGRRAATVGYAVPGPVVAMGVVVALVAVDQALDPFGRGLPGTVATGSFLALAYAYAVRFLAPAITSTESGLEQVPEPLTDSARSLGARPWTVLARVHLPLSRASLATAAILVGVDALKELPIALLLRPIGFDTLPVWVYNLASESRFQQAALPALTIVAVALVPVALLNRRLDGGRT